jgi:methionyl-tRNA formyltransferase
MTNKRIVFMGTPEFAAHCLTQLLEEKFNIVGVVTVADKPAGRGQTLQESAVKKVAIKHELPILQPLKLKDEDFLAVLQSWNADLFVVIAFRMLPEVVWNMPPLGSINLHGSLLPQFRGAAPINHAIISGESETGVTTFFIEQEIDRGQILLQERTTIGENETAGELHDRLMQIGALLVCKTLIGVFDGTLKATPQTSFDLSNIKHAPKIFKADCEINWKQNAQTIHNFIRGLSPYPAAWTTFLLPERKTAKIFSTRKTEKRMAEKTGSILLTKEQLFIQCEDFALEILELQLEGKKRVQVAEFVRGLRTEIATVS